jgi:hypothetical protein
VVPDRAAGDPGRRDQPARIAPVAAGRAEVGAAPARPRRRTPALGPPLDPRHCESVPALRLCFPAGTGPAVLHQQLPAPDRAGDPRGAAAGLPHAGRHAGAGFHPDPAVRCDLPPAIRPLPADRGATAVAARPVVGSPGGGAALTAMPSDRRLHGQDPQGLHRARRVPRDARTPRRPRPHRAGPRARRTVCRRDPPPGSDEAAGLRAAHPHRRCEGHRHRRDPADALQRRPPRATGRAGDRGGRRARPVARVHRRHAGGGIGREPQPQPVPRRGRTGAGR